jgi:hypothetical protein
MFGDAGEHPWAQFLTIMKCEDEVRIAFPAQYAV